VDYHSDYNNLFTNYTNFNFNMSKILIENYKGWEIYFDNNKENFYTSSDSYDRECIKTSYAAAKKYIDDFIKDNITFEPIVIEKKDHRGATQIKLIGIRKDGRFVYEGKDGKKEQLSEWDEKYYYLPTEENNEALKKIAEKQQIIDDISLEISALEKEIIKTPIIQQLKEKYKQLIG